MSKRRRPGDWVRIVPSAGFVGESDRLKAQIQDQGSQPCWGLSGGGCDDPDCVEWSTLWTEPDPQNGGKRCVLCHVSECQMLDIRMEILPGEAMTEDKKPSPIPCKGHWIRSIDGDDYDCARTPRLDEDGKDGCMLSEHKACCCTCVYHIPAHRHCGVDRKPDENCVCNIHIGWVCALPLMDPRYSPGKPHVHINWPEHGLCECHEEKK